MVYGVSTKSDGNMSFRFGDPETVLSNRRLWLGAHGIKPENCVTVLGQHRDDVVIVDGSMAGHGMLGLETALPADALITQEKGLGLFLLTADCLPLVLVDSAESIIALVHASRQTASLGLPAKVLRVLIDQFGQKAENIQAIFGPSIAAESYLLPSPIEQAADPDWQPFLRTVDSNVAVDLVGFTADQLRRAGLLAENMTFSHEDTAQLDNEYFSHYRSARTGEPEGRFATVVSLFG
jgi:hypothetical protein